MVKEETEDQLRLQWLQLCAERAEKDLDMQLQLMEVDMSQPILADAMHRWIEAMKELKEFKYKVEVDQYIVDKDKFFRNAGTNSPSTKERVYINWDDNEGV